MGQYKENTENSIRKDYYWIQSPPTYSVNDSWFYILKKLVFKLVTNFVTLESI